MWITNKNRLQLHCVGGNSLNFSQKINFYLQNCPVASLHKCLWMPNFISATGSQCNFWAPLKFVLIFKWVSDGCTCRPATLTLCIYWSPWHAALRRATIQSQPTCWIEPFLKVDLKINRFASGVGKQNPLCSSSLVAFFFHLPVFIRHALHLNAEHPRVVFV